VSTKRRWADSGPVTTPRDRAESDERSFWLNRLVAALGAVVLIGGSAALLRWSDSLALTYVSIAVGVVILAMVGVLVKRRTEDRARTPGLD
jgi:hypothetical protein